MEEDYTIIYVEQPEQSAWGIIGRGINQYNHQQAGDDHSQILCFALQDADQVVVGGVVGAIYWNWLYVDLMWIKDDLRGRGYGHQLITLLEEEARQRGATNAFLDTFSFQAPDFYKKHGYRVFGELPEFPPGHRRYYLSKKL